jgi:hypothetical protein
MKLVRARNRRGCIAYRMVDWLKIDPDQKLAANVLDI